MAKITLPSIASGYNPATINSNFQLIASALNDRVLYRANVGTEPNQMINMLDMNNFRIINLPEPLTDTEPFRKKDGTVFAGQMDAKVALAQGYANQAGVSAGQAAVSAGQAANSAALAASSAASVLTNANVLTQKVIEAGQAIASDLTNKGEAQVALATAEADRASNAANASVASATASANSANEASLFVNDATAAAAQAQSIADSLAGGTIGFDAVGYDFGYVADATTYFNRNFGTLV